MIDYNKILVEVDEILKYMPEEELLKIPLEIRQLIKNNKDKEYFWKYDETKDLKDQDLSRDTIAFLSYLNMEFLLEKEQKELMQQFHQINQNILEKEKRKKYNPNNIFDSKQNTFKDTSNVESQDLVVYKKNIFANIFNKLKYLFKNVKGDKKF